MADVLEANEALLLELPPAPDRTALAPPVLVTLVTPLTLAACGGGGSAPTSVVPPPQIGRAHV